MRDSCVKAKEIQINVVVFLRVGFHVDVKFALVIKNIICFFTRTPMCKKHCILGQYTLSSPVKRKSSSITKLTGS